MKLRTKVLLAVAWFLTSCSSKPKDTKTSNVYNLGNGILTNTINISKHGVLIALSDSGTITFFNLKDSSSRAIIYSGKADFVGQPAFHGTNLIFPSDAKLLCLTNNGLLKWSRTFSDRIKAAIEIHNDKIYFQVRGEGIYCLNALDGKTIWLKPSNQGTVGGLTVERNTVVVSGLGDSIVALNANNGLSVWSKELRDGMLSGISFQGDSYAVSNCQLLTKDKSSILIFSGTSGAKISAIDLNVNCRYRPLIIGRHVFAGTEDSRIVCYDYVTGKKQWDSKLPDSDVIGTDFVFSDNQLYLGSINRRLYKIDSNTGKIMHSINYEYGLSSLFTFENSVYFVIGNGDLIKI